MITKETNHFPSILHCASLAPTRYIHQSCLDHQAWVSASTVVACIVTVYDSYRGSVDIVETMQNVIQSDVRVVMLICGILSLASLVFDAFVGALVAPLRELERFKISQFGVRLKNSLSLSLSTKSPLPPWIRIPCPKPNVIILILFFPHHLTSSRLYLSYVCM